MCKGSISSARKGLTLPGLEVNSKDWRVEIGLDVIEPCLLRRGPDGVQGAEGEAEQAVQVALRGEGARHGLGRLDRLLGDREVAHLDDIGIDNAAGRAAIAVGDGPPRAVDLGRRVALGGRVQGLAVDEAHPRVGAEDPEIRRARVDVEVEGLGRRADLDRGQPLDVVLLGGRDNGSEAALLAVGGHAQGGGESLGDRLSVFQVCLCDLNGTASPEPLIVSLFDGEATRVWPGRRGKSRDAA